MSSKGYAMVCAMVLCSLGLFGCPPTRPARVAQGVNTASDIRKAELLRQLDKKWENPVTHYELGQLYHAEGDWSKADWYYDQAIGFNPAYRDAQAAKVKMQLDKGDKSKSEYLASMFMTQVVSAPEQLMLLGEAFEKQGLDSYALKCYRDALKAQPDSYKINRQLAYYYLHKNDNEQAKEYFIRSFNMNSNQPDVANELGKLGVAVRSPEPGTSPSKLGQPIRP
ncbi:MAG: tetratricopeptide repeat protein [Sedimentisphaerales bacterium]|nr:tetratricopeptide repeat protein [Sedimentisphaerales bacterium]